jgi:hypothetical protein
VQVVLQALAFAQRKFPGHEPDDCATHAPLPSQYSVGVNVVVLHVEV